MRISLLALVWLSLWAMSAHAGAVNAFQDPLESPAPRNALGVYSQLADVTNAGGALVAVGAKGLILRSSDRGETWQQMDVPASSDLTAVHFPSDLAGWAVGHGGIVLHSNDGGVSWVKQFDGHQAKEMLIAHFSRLADAGNPLGDLFLPEVELSYADGPEQALLDVWFENESDGFVVGSFGTLFRTRDGGKTWASWVERVETDMPLHFNAIKRIGDDLFIASEQGVVFRLDRQQQKFVARQTGYDGSLFSLAGEGRTVVAFGLRGEAYRSRDAGETWQAMEAGFDGTVSDAVMGADGSILAVTRNGQLLESPSYIAPFNVLPVQRSMLFMGMALTGDLVFIVGTNGVQRVSLR